MMQGIDMAKKAVEKAVNMGASQAEAIILVGSTALTRYTHNAIHQNVVKNNTVLNLEVVIGKNKIGTSVVNSLSENAIDQSVERAIKIGKISTPDPDFKHYPEPLTIEPLPDIYDSRTANVTPEERAEAVKTLIETALDHDKRVTWSTGAYTVDTGTYAVANSLGVEAEMTFAAASADIVTKAGDDAVQGSGYRAARSLKVSDFDFGAMARSAAEDAVDSIEPKLIPIGEYEAVLTPSATSTLTGFMGRLGFSARSYQDGFSCLTDKIGSQVFDEKLTVHDKGRSLETFGARPFDGEGVPKGTLRLVKDGVPENLCYDNYTALKDGTVSTGHAMSKAGSSYFRGFPMPMNMVVEPGDAAVDEMIEDTKRGVLITRFHYVNAIRNDLAIISGLTRDACWLIENGEVKHPIKVMRFTDSVLRVMKEIDMIGGNSTVEKLPSATLPALKVAKFKFTGQSEF